MKAKGGGAVGAEAMQPPRPTATGPRLGNRDHAHTRGRGLQLPAVGEIDGVERAADLVCGEKRESLAEGIIRGAEKT